jgi:hypothetical protein
MASEQQQKNIPTFKLVLGEHIVVRYLSTRVSDHSPLNFSIDNVYWVLDDLTPLLLAPSPRPLLNISLNRVQLAMAELERPLSSR